MSDHGQVARAPNDARGDTDWAVRTADTIERLVGSVHDKAVAPVTSAARWIVYGLVAAAVGMAAVVLLAIGIVRVVIAYVPPHEAYAAEGYAGGIFFLLGLFLWSKRASRR